MKKDNKQKQGKEPVTSVKTPRPPQVMDPSKAPASQKDTSSDESPNGKIKRKQSADADRELSPSEEL